jgi:hypothetical protein
MNIENHPNLERRLADFVRETDDMFKKFANETYLSMTAKNLPMTIAFVGVEMGFAKQFAKKFGIAEERIPDLIQDTLFLHSFSSIYHFLKEKENINND